MAQASRFAAIALASLITAIPGWAAPSNPALMATPPQPKWSDLSIPQRIVLAPLSDDWDAMENYRQKKWISIAARFSEMPPEEQRRIQVQMQSWDKLSPEERNAARENFKTANQLPTEKKQQLKQKWEEYSSLRMQKKRNSNNWLRVVYGKKHPPVTGTNPFDCPYYRDATRHVNKHIGISHLANKDIKQILYLL